MPTEPSAGPSRTNCFRSMAFWIRWWSISKNAYTTTQYSERKRIVSIRWRAHCSASATDSELLISAEV